MYNERKVKEQNRQYEGSPKRYRTFFFFNLLLYLQLNQTCLLQSTPLYCWYNAPSVFSSSGTRPGTCFAGWREGPVANFLLSPLPSEIGDLLGWTSTLGNGKSLQVPNLESRGAGARHCLLLRQKFTDKKRRVGRCIVMVQHPGLVCPRLRSKSCGMNFYRCLLLQKLHGQLDDDFHV